LDQRPRTPWADQQQFRAARPIRELRDLTRYRRKLVEAQAAERKPADQAAGECEHQIVRSGQRCVRRLGPGDVAGADRGEQSPVDMAQLARGRMRRKQPELARALDGHVNEHHRFMLRLQLQRITAAEADLAHLDERLSEKLAP